MSKFNRTSMNGVYPTTLLASDQRALPARLQDRGKISPWEDGMNWPNSRALGGGMAGPLGQDASMANGRYDVWPLDAGCSGRKTISGITKDSTGAALAGVSVQITSADSTSEGDVTISDAAGYYLATIQDPGAGFYQIDAYLVGSPDVAGTTVNNIIPT